MGPRKDAGRAPTFTASRPCVPPLSLPQSWPYLILNKIFLIINIFNSLIPIQFNTRVAYWINPFHLFNLHALNVDYS